MSKVLKNTFVPCSCDPSSLVRKKDLRIKKTDPICLHFIFKIDGVMMAIEDVDEVVEILDRIGPDAEDIVRVPEVDQGLLRAFGEDSSLPFRHIDVSIGGSELLPHGRPMSLEVKVANKLNVVTAEAQLEEEEKLPVGPLFVRKEMQHSLDRLQSLLCVNVRVECIDIHGKD